MLNYNTGLIDTGEPVIREEGAADFAVRGTTAFVVALVLGVWITVPALASHTESALQDVRADDSSSIPALTGVATADSVVEELEETDTVAETDNENADAPAVSNSTQRTSEMSLPSFRRQMYRTDI